MLQMKRETNKMAQARGGGLRLGLARVDHLALFMQVAPSSIHHAHSRDYQVRRS